VRRQRQLASLADWSLRACPTRLPPLLPGFSLPTPSRSSSARLRDGTFGAVLSVKGDKQWAYEEPVVTWDMQCELGFILYNQCILSALVAIILMVFGSIAFLGITTALCLCLGCCNCCFVKRQFGKDEEDKVSSHAAPRDS